MSKVLGSESCGFTNLLADEDTGTKSQSLGNQPNFVSVQVGGTCWEVPILGDKFLLQGPRWPWMSSLPHNVSSVPGDRNGQYKIKPHKARSESKRKP